MAQATGRPADRGRYGRSVADLDELTRRFRASGHDPDNRSPFSAGLDRGVARRPDIVEILQSAPEHQQLPVLLRAAVHSMVLERPGCDLGKWYPTVTDHADTSDPFPEFARFCLQHEEELRSIVARRSVQTNEVGRCALLLPALGSLADEAGPLSLVDVGTSAGLNLRLDSYGYDYAPGGRLGDVGRVHITTEVRRAAPIPTRMPTIVDRLGLDRAPIDVTDAEDARWLLACIWPDQADRFARLAGAIEIAREVPVTLRRGDAVDDLAETVAFVSGGDAHPVVLNTWVLNYLPDDRRARYVAELNALGATQDLSWVFAESPGLCPGLPTPSALEGEHITVLTCVRWRRGVRTVDHLATAHPHGYWLDWMHPNERVRAG